MKNKSKCSINFYIVFKSFNHSIAFKNNQGVGLKHATKGRYIKEPNKTESMQTQ